MDSHNGVHIFEDVTCFTKESVEDAGLVSVLRVNDRCRLPGTEGEGEGQGGRDRGGGTGGTEGEGQRGRVCVSS